MNFNKTQIGLFLIVLFVLCSGLALYSLSLATDEISQIETLPIKAREVLDRWISYTNLFLIVEAIVGIATTALLLTTSKRNQELEEDTLNKEIYTNNDLIVEKTKTIKDKESNELKSLTHDITSLCKKSLKHYNFCKQTLNIIGQHLPLVQGAFYNTAIVNNEDYIELTAGYAFDKPEHGKIKFLFGEGLAGQAAKSKKVAQITNVPESYLQVSSGLGTTNKVSLFEFPLLFKKDVVGVIELSFFKSLTKEEIEQIEKLTSQIAKKIIETKKES